MYLPLRLMAPELARMQISYRAMVSIHRSYDSKYYDRNAYLYYSYNANALYETTHLVICQGIHNNKTTIPRRDMVANIKASDAEMAYCDYELQLDWLAENIYTLPCFASLDLRLRVDIDVLCQCLGTKAIGNIVALEATCQIDCQAMQNFHNLEVLDIHKVRNVAPTDIITILNANPGLRVLALPMYPMGDDMWYRVMPALLAHPVMQSVQSLKLGSGKAYGIDYPEQKRDMSNVRRMWQEYLTDSAPELLSLHLTQFKSYMLSKVMKYRSANQLTALHLFCDTNALHQALLRLKHVSSQIQIQTLCLEWSVKMRKTACAYDTVALAIKTFHKTLRVFETNAQFLVTKAEFITSINNLPGLEIFCVPEMSCDDENLRRLMAKSCEPSIRGWACSFSGNSAAAVRDFCESFRNLEYFFCGSTETENYEMSHLITTRKIRELTARYDQRRNLDLKHMAAKTYARSDIALPERYQLPTEVWHLIMFYRRRKYVTMADVVEFYRKDGL